MAGSELDNGIYLRSTLNAELVDGLHALTAFSPDVIPLSHTLVDPDALIKSYDQFIAHDIDPDDASTPIYLRGKAVVRGKGCPEHVTTTVSLRAIQNELLLWPQVWEDASPFGSKTLTASKDGEIVATADPLDFTARQSIGRHDTLIATTDATPHALSEKVKNWRDLVKYVGNNPTLSTYNCTFADPASLGASVTTRLRLLNDKPEGVKLVFSIEPIGIPGSGIEASFSCFGSTPPYKPFAFGQQRVPIYPSNSVTQTVDVPSNFDGMLTLNVFNDKEQVFANYSSISIVVYAEEVVNGDTRWVLLGAEHIVFDSNRRVRRLVRRYENRWKLAGESYDFYFRDSLTSGPEFPRDGNPSHSPGISAS
ncbi:uncharacterized protein FIBRA_08799 [Fibroporia radiculosa]|uniref:Uncharacterized protein n=1 Tax=Fibroporia radiculosa TaxID=599839 RepID=J4ICJ6_9APHY|nr:uncharacterized protein FIBRA_08799 [Fibroporia radiculosa]CCM06526.1 predicted protein [Fibroporia radiculosa]